MKPALMAASSLLVAAWASAAHAQEGAWYVAGGVGYGGGGDVTVEDWLTPGAKIEPESDMRFMVGGGYDWNDWRFQVDAADRFNQYGAVASTGFGNSDIQNVALIGSIIRDFPDVNGGAIGGYLGLGVGYAEVRYSAIFSNPNVESGVEHIVHKTDGLAGHALVGLNVRITRNLSADLEYRYFRYGEDVRFDIAGGAPNLDAYDSNDVFLSLRYSFLPPPPPPVAPAPPPRAPVAAPDVVCEDTPFVVYFEWDSSELTDQAREVIETAARQAEACRITRVEIVGHADRSGPTAYNLPLSERRAGVVSEAFVGLGVPQSIIAVTARGEADPAVDTPDGVREPLNRRSNVVIHVGGRTS